MYSSPATSRPVTPQAAQLPIERADAPQVMSRCRLMQVKVVYTFDDVSKIICLARCPQLLPIRTAVLDDSAEIGIIELRTCIQTIVTASPELIAKLGQDYTVYAYDYSEYETPLVGQGMLSWVLASASATPTAPAHQSRTMVTGRVSKNGSGLFSDGIKETLDVKLRLVPVPTCLQSEYLASMAKYREASNLAAEGVDVDAWTTFLRANPGFSLTNSTLDASSPSIQQQQIYGGQDTRAMRAACDITQPLHTFHTQSKDIHSCATIADSLQNPLHNQNTTELERRPLMPVEKGKNKRRAPSRPSSRASNREKQDARPKASLRTNSRLNAEAGVADEGPSRKRARTTKANWHGPSTFAPNVEALRVTASTAASIRGHTKANAHPKTSDLVANDICNRPPTPRPTLDLQHNSSALMRQSHLLSNEINHATPHGYTSPYPKDESQSALTSPECLASSLDSTPANMPSSPPIPRPRSRSISSPALPKLLHDMDSGYASGPLEDYMGDDIDGPSALEADGMCTTLQSRARAATLASDISDSKGTPIHRTQLSQDFALQFQHQAISSSEKVPSNFAKETNSFSLDDCAQDGSCDRQDLSRSSKEDLSPSPCATPRPSLQRSDSWSSAALFTSDTSARVGPITLLSNKQTTGTSLKRKKAIQERLHSSIAAGQMPPFCRNCGEISTPTWRKAFTKIENGSPDKLNEHDDGFVMWESLSKSDSGAVTSFRVIRKAVTAEDKGFEEIQLCNPCGIWLFKNRSMRPPEKWTKSTAEAPKPKRRSSKKLTTIFSGDAGPSSDAQSVAELEANIDTDNDVAKQQQPSLAVGSRGKDTRAASFSTSMSTVKSDLLGESAPAAALQRAIQSSPPRFPGSKQSPIDLDAESSPQPTRRLLFPSPRQPGETKVLDGPSLELYGRDNSDLAGQVTSPCLTAEDKENSPPLATHDNDRLDPLFQASRSQTPCTPETAHSYKNAFKTPSISATKLAMALDPFLSPTRRSTHTPMTPSRVLRLDATDLMTPFTAQLTQLMSEADLPEVGDMAGLDIFNDDLGDVSQIFGFQGFHSHDQQQLHMAESTRQTLFSFYEENAGAATESLDKSLVGKSIEAFLSATDGEEGLSEANK